MNNPQGLIVRAKVGDMSSLVEEISKLWSSYNNKEPFSYTVLDDAYKATYLSDKKAGDILKIFAFLTIFVACLGLLGLVTFTAEQKFKEIGIRKVLGSSVVQIVVMLTKVLVIYFIFHVISLSSRLFFNAKLAGSLNIGRFFFFFFCFFCNHLHDCFYISIN